MDSAPDPPESATAAKVEHSEADPAADADMVQVPSEEVAWPTEEAAPPPQADQVMGETSEPDSEEGKEGRMGLPPPSP